MPGLPSFYGGMRIEGGTGSLQRRKEKNHSMEVIEISLDQVVPYAKNPRNNAEAVEVVANSIKEFGFRVPIILDQNHTIIAGHMRVLAAKRLGMETVPAVMAEDLTEEQIRAFRLADNKTAEAATWNEDLLQKELDDILNIDMEQFGFELPDVLEDDEPTPEKPEVEFTEELLEENNYVVLFFDNSIDWLQAQSVLGLKTVKALDSKPGFEKSGVGRVINGAKLIQKMAEEGIEL